MHKIEAALEKQRALLFSSWENATCSPRSFSKEHHDGGGPDACSIFYYSHLRGFPETHKEIHVPIHFTGKHGKCHRVRSRELLLAPLNNISLLLHTGTFLSQSLQMQKTSPHMKVTMLADPELYMSAMV